MGSDRESNPDAEGPGGQRHRGVTRHYPFERLTHPEAPKLSGQSPEEPEASAVVMEIVERGRTSDGTIGGSLIMPSEVRINGMPIVTAGGVKVHEMSIQPRKDMVTVTVTLPVRLLIIGAEGDVNALNHHPDGEP